MTTKQRREQPAELDRHEGETRSALIGKQVINALGQPAGLLQVQVRPLWESYYRVNVFVGPDAVSARVANSYFLKTDDDGTIIASTPPITKQHGHAAEVPAGNSSPSPRPTFTP